jgi:hypothetical protein
VMLVGVRFILHRIQEFRSVSKVDERGRRCRASGTHLVLDREDAEYELIAVPFFAKVGVRLRSKMSS